MDYKELLAKKIQENLDVDLKLDFIEDLIKIPPKPEMGDYAFPCFQLAKSLKKSPNIIAEELKNKIEGDYFEKIENKGPYLNFFVNKGIFTKYIDKNTRRRG